MLEKIVEKNKQKVPFLKNWKLALGLVATLGAATYVGVKMHEQKSSKFQEIPLKYKFEFVDDETLKVFSGDLQGKKVGWTSRIMLLDKENYDENTGLDSVFFVNPKKRLESVWKHKMEKSNNKAVDQFYKDVVSDYSIKNATRMSLDNYLLEISHSLKDVNNNLDWGHVAKSARLDSRRKNLLMNIVSTYNAKDILAYSLTELSPSFNGELNKNLFEFKINVFGTEYVDKIPAMGDKLLSVGPYQFTSNAVYDDGKRREGASIINLALPSENRIPGSVSMLGGRDQHKAAYMFAIFNWTTILRNLNDNQISKLEKNYLKNEDVLVQIAAVSHYNPVRSRRAIRAWLNDDMKKPFEAYCSETKNVRVRSYAIKTKNNLEAVANHDGTYFVSPVQLNESVQRNNELDAPTFKLVREENSRGYTVFRYDVQEKDNHIKIARRFNKDTTSNNYSKINIFSFVDVGGELKTDLVPGEPVYILVKKK